MDGQSEVRKDLAVVASKVDYMAAGIDKLNNKIDKVHDELNDKIDKVHSELDKKINQVLSELDKKIDALRDHVDRKSMH